MDLLRWCYEGKLFDGADNIEVSKRDIHRRKRYSRLCRGADRAIVVLGEGDITAGTVVPVFLDFRLKLPDGIVDIVMRRQPDSNADELESKERNEEYFALTQLHTNTGQTVIATVTTARQG